IIYSTVNLLKIGLSTRRLYINITFTQIYDEISRTKHAFLTQKAYANLVK
ncbi:1300_t:CDS:1, partial [Racocetra persica]